MDTMEWYRRAQDGFDDVLASVPPGRWDSPSTCPGWTVRDVAGHVVWGQLQLRAWATGADFADRSGAPGAPHPAGLAGEDPVTSWRTARDASLATLTEDALTRPTTIPGMGEVPVVAVVRLLRTDLVAHTWDIGHALAMDVRLDPVLVTMAFEWARAHAVRRPGFFGPELTPPGEADEQARMLAFIGRAAWQPVAA
ncbi:TIGR03086 family metal-binding protein [Amycolatopsis acidiphila]|uniref:TIGR03086 family protein n=1 Tax=Amycolatopsis acidiphila TaxID=715473 RepID=A0A558A520_9PSEU|nr:TIGR03086 family metal-binding protein [Amycolatopsis acidiphila]TVT19346.1 TIGR03086 family protein [Amycolatopsis acidiphila]UIJ61712.1 TIGR03086 family metal-binding protein [Amycolatopsis acidiphila]GHG58277.1 TIGR03086 family protein [Amycolatopsis acidiphila]